MAVMRPLDLLLRGRIREQYYGGEFLNDVDGGEDVRSAEGAGAGAEALAAPDDPATKRHLIVLVNGLFGSAENWDVVVECLRARLDEAARRETLVAASKASSRRQTYEGIDRCGLRLVAEVEELKAGHPNLERISLVGHSMGGLICRHAAGLMYDPQTGTIAGLRPAHFITMAAPHLGCETGLGPAQVPLIHWFERMPRVQEVVANAAPKVTPWLFGHAGRQFFLGDAAAEPGREPILVRLTRDVAGEGAFLTALAAFRSRTAYANSGGDHLVGWANASLRRSDQLPSIPLEGGLGVVREDPLAAGFAPQLAAQLRPHLPEASRPGSGALSLRTSASSNSAEFFSPQPSGALSDAAAATAEATEATEAGVKLSRAASAAVSLQATSSRRLSRRPSSVLGDDGRTQSGCFGRLTSRKHSGSEGGDGGAELRSLNHAANSSADLQAAQLSPQVGGMLERLTSVPWRRVDVSFTGARMPYTAHNLIQVTRRWINYEGVQVARHLAEQIATLEAVDRAAAGGPD